MLDGLVVDLFAGGGGASAGIEAALGRPVDIAINHDPVALAVHKANHPATHHVEEDIWKANPGELVAMADRAGREAVRPRIAAAVHREVPAEQHRPRA